MKTASGLFSQVLTTHANLLTVGSLTFTAYITGFVGRYSTAALNAGGSKTTAERTPVGLGDGGRSVVATSADAVSAAGTLRSQGHTDLEGRGVSIEGRGIYGRLGMWDVVWCLERVFWYH